MTGGSRLLTALVLAIPLVLLVRSAASPVPAWHIVAVVGIVLGGLCLFTWLFMRPKRFEIDSDVEDQVLRIVWPLRTREIKRKAIVGVEVVLKKEFRKRFGAGIRLGIGGLGGTFGFLQTEREVFSTWISRYDAFVVIWLSGGEHPLLITPDDPERFVTALHMT